MLNTFKIGTKEIGLGMKPFMIAEMSGNHNRSLDTALAIIDAAAASGADAVKIQTYTPDTLTLDVRSGDFLIEDPNSLWFGRTLYDLYGEAHTPWTWHEAIFKRAAERGILCFSTPFDDTSVDFLEQLGVPAYKIASFENNHLPLLKKVAATGKPVIVSTGISTLTDLSLAYDTLEANGCNELVLLKCTSTYPALPSNSNLKTIPHLREMFNCQVGLSDHTLGIGVAVAAIALGATVIEKHFTLDRSEGGVDSAFSLEPKEFEMLVEECNRAFLSLGSVKYGILDDEKKSARFKRSIYITADMKKGDEFTTNNIKIIRPGFGLPPLFYDIILGKRINQDARRGIALTHELIG